MTGNKKPAWEADFLFMTVNAGAGLQPQQLAGKLPVTCPRTRLNEYPGSLISLQGKLASANPDLNRVSELSVIAMSKKPSWIYSLHGSSNDSMVLL
jgi:hypothetical protein